MNLRIAARLCMAVLAALGPSCEGGGPPTLVLHNDGLHLATVTLVETIEVRDDTANSTFNDTTTMFEDLKPGQTLTREFSYDLKTLEVEVVRTGDGMVVLRRTYSMGDFDGAKNELEIVVRP